MVSRADIQAYADKIAERFHPEKIILFGSYAYGTPTEDSDVDLMVIMDHEGKGWEKATEISLEIEFPGFPTDLLVKAPTHVQKRLSECDPFFEDVMNQGIALYAREYSAVA